MTNNRKKNDAFSYLRLDDLTCNDWRPLTINELRMIQPIKLTYGKAKVNRLLLARLLGERDRLLLVCETARWVASLAVRDGVLERNDKVDATDMERAVAWLVDALQTLDLDCEGTDIVSSADAQRWSLDDVVDNDNIEL